jgi:hypothetical protein
MSTGTVFDRTLIYGWTLEQFARAKAHHRLVTGEDVQDALALHKWWFAHRSYEPGQIKLEGYDLPPDWEWAGNEWRRLLTESMT